MAFNNFQKQGPPSVFGFVLGGYLALMISDLDMIEDLYINKNKFFDKHEKTYLNFYPAMHENVIFSKSHELWQKKRKVLNVAFYKEKLGKMMGMLKDVTYSQFDKIDKEYIS
eukprot:CAMPEP_0170549972 /NCGR_PEP_ID=MMETSP0211-20121228/8042_1 /TAXON_ID=311385 /ORGANISM="Pseudokeronopsis sp., Strain OXSARD2" /LENGTH=111 /DNA_ID=CAMNT_0010856231 /DNA_START=158 /DNA_END=493 /DNA_ORIENTATION=+